jgi:hypothetical protein
MTLLLCDPVLNAYAAGEPMLGDECDAIFPEVDVA